MLIFHLSLPFCPSPSLPHPFLSISLSVSISLFSHLPSLPFFLLPPFSFWCPSVSPSLFSSLPYPSLCLFKIGCAGRCRGPSDWQVLIPWLLEDPKQCSWERKRCISVRSFSMNICIIIMKLPIMQPWPKRHIAKIILTRTGWTQTRGRGRLKVNTQLYHTALFVPLCPSPPG